MEEFDIDSSFDEWTATFLGRESLGCGKRSTVVQYGEDDKSKDDLGEAIGLKDKTESSRGNEDPGHQWVTGAAENDSMIGAPRSERTKDDGVE